jgi:mannitol-specific phosphotransferase system IIBC component
MDGRPENCLSLRGGRVTATRSGYLLKGAFPMLKTVLAAALAVAFVVAFVVAFAPTALAMSELKIAEAAANPTPQQQQQQQKMKDCNDKWKEERANTGAKGGTAYRKFLSACLKKTSA